MRAQACACPPRRWKAQAADKAMPSTTWTIWLAITLAGGGRIRSTRKMVVVHRAPTAIMRGRDGAWTPVMVTERAPEAVQDGLRKAIACRARARIASQSPAATLSAGATQEPPTSGQLGRAR